MQVAAVVVSWNSAADLPTCLDALVGQDHPDLEIVVVDNASSDDSRAVVERYVRDHGVRLIRNATNRGFAGGVNDALAQSDAEGVLLCNPDAAPRPDHVRHLAAALAADGRRGAVQGKLLRTAGSADRAPLIDGTGHVAFRTRLFRNRGEGEPDRGQYERPGPVFGVSGALALYRRAMLDDVAMPSPVGPPEIFDEDLFAYFEDVDLDWRAAMRGWTAWYEPRAVASHERGGSGPRRTPFVEELNFVNRLAVVIKCDDPRRLLTAAPWVLLTTGLKALELLITVPRAFLGAVRRLPGALRIAARKRAAVHDRATVPSADVVDRWFGPFDYRAWVATWWRRVRGA